MTVGKVAIAILFIVILLVIGMLALDRANAQAPSFEMQWTSPGDDGNVGTASRYEMRYRTVPVAGVDTLSWWNAATIVNNLPVPAVAGTLQTVSIPSGLVYNTTYYFIMRTFDDGLPTSNMIGGIPAPIPNVSFFSNIGTKVMGPAPDMIAPAAIRDLLAR